MMRDLSIGLITETAAAWITDPDGNAIELMQLHAISPQKAVAAGEQGLDFRAKRLPGCSKYNRSCAVGATPHGKVL